MSGFHQDEVWHDGMNLQEITAYLIMFLVLTIRPQGLFAQIQQKKV